MAAAAQTADRGHRARRAEVDASVAWRLLVLAGLTYGVMLILGGTAQAAECEGAECETPQRTPLAATLAESTAHLTETTRVLVTETTHRVAEPVAAEATSGNDLSAPATGTVSNVHDTVVAAVTSTELSATPQEPTRDLIIAIPSLEQSSAPVISTVTQALDQTVTEVAVGTSSIPVLGTASAELKASVTTSTQLLDATAGTLTGTADTVLINVTDALEPALAPLATLGAQIDITAGAAPTGAAGASTGGSTGDTLSGALFPEPSSGTALDQDALDFAGHPLRSVSGTPTVPPPDAAGTVAVQSAPDIVTVVAVPMSGAGTTANSPGAPTAPTGGTDLAKCLIGEFRPAPLTLTGPVNVAARPLPGTPLVDPSFSPD